MNQCVPSWDLDDPAVGAGSAGGGFRTAVSSAHHRAAVAGQTFSPVVVPMSDQSYYEVAELTWEKGNISSHGLLNRPNKYPPAAAASQQLQPIGGSPPAPGGDRETLEAVVSEAAARSHFPQQLQPWRGAPLPADALVPCATRHDEQEEEEEETRRKRARVVCASQGSVAPGTTTTMLALDAACATTGDVCGFTTTNNNNSTSLDRDDDNKGSPDTENTSIGGGAASDSRCFSRRSQRDGLCDEGENVVINGEPAMRSSVSTKRSRAAAIHNESERKRRDRINQKMKTLQKLVPNSSKTDKASMLDEVIDYLKQLQAQVQVMSRMSSMMMPMAMPQLQMSVMAQMAQMAQMSQMAQGMMNMGSLAQPGYAPPPMMHPAPFIPMPSWDASAAAGAGAAADRTPQLAAGSMPDAFAAFLACQQAQQNGQQQPGGMEAYNRMLAMCQKLQQSQPSTSKQ